MTEQLSFDADWDAQDAQEGRCTSCGEPMDTKFELVSERLWEFHELCDSCGHDDHYRVEWLGEDDSSDSD